MGQTQCWGCSGQAAATDLAHEGDASQYTVQVAGEEDLPLAVVKDSFDEDVEEEKKKGNVQEQGETSPSLSEQAVASVTTSSHMSETIPERLRDGLAKVKALCVEARILDAKEELQKLEEEAPRYCVDDPGALQEFKDVLDADPDITFLRGMQERLREAMQLLRPQAMYNGPKDSRWAHCNITDPDVGPNFKADIKIRFAEASERDKGGASTQIVISGKLTEFPMALEHFVSVYRETDLYRKEWIDHCERIEGKVGGPEKNWGALSRVINASPLLPWRMELLTVREFVVCTNPPIDGHGPGVLVLDTSPPGNTSTYADWELPPKDKSLTRLTGLLAIMYFEPRADGGCDVFAMSKMGIPMPQWFCPLSLVKRFLAGHFVSVFKAIKLKIGDKWEEMKYADRIAMYQAFYRRISNLSSSAISARS